MAGKEAVMVVLDCGKSMFQPPSSSGQHSALASQSATSTQEASGFPKTRLEVALDCVALLFQQKLLFNSKTHETGMFLFGGDFELENELYGMKMGRTTLENIRYVETLRKELVRPEGEGDCFNALYSAVEHLEKYIGKKKVTKKIFFMTCAHGASKYTVGTMRDKFITKILMAGCRINIIAVDCEKSEVNGEPEANGRKEGLSEDQKANFELFRILEQKGIARVFSSMTAMQIYKQFRGKSIFPVAKYKGPLTISPDLKLNVKIYAKTAEQSFPQLHKYSKLTPFQKEENANKVQIDRFSYIYDDETLTPVPKENMVKAFSYGKKLIPVSNEILEDIKYKASKCLQLICFVPSANVPRHYFMGSVEMVIPDEEIRHNVDGMAALIQGMYELETVGLFRYVNKEGVAPRLVVLSPHISTDYHCFFLNTLPTSEDFRDFVFSPLKESSSVQQIAMQGFVESLDLMNVPCANPNQKESGSHGPGSTTTGNNKGQNAQINTGKEGLVPNSTFNPVLQYFYQCLSFRAENPEAPLPPLNPIISEYVRPDRRLFERAAKPINDIKALFPLKETPFAIAAAAKSNRIFWRDIVHLQREHLEGHMIIESEGRSVKISKNVLAEEDKREIGTIDPVGDFKEMIQNTKTDLTNEAISQMKKVILELLRSSLKGNLHKKASECLKALRDGCITENEAEEYNDFLRNELFSDILKRRDVEGWVKVVKGEGTGVDLGLITEEECSSAVEVKKEDADKFNADCESGLARCFDQSAQDQDKNEMLDAIE